jgi:type IV pilus assembly protein PilX
MKSRSQSIGKRGRQKGAVLVISLLLLVVITTLAISGMNTASTELAMARNDQNYEFAFQAAETGLETVMSLGRFIPSPTAISFDPAFVTDAEHDEYVATLTYEAPTLVPDAAFSLGVGSGISAYHFRADSQAVSRRTPGGDTARDASALHTQAFYVVGPGDDSL